LCEAHDADRISIRGVIVGEHVLAAFCCVADGTPHRETIGYGYRGLVWRRRDAYRDGGGRGLAAAIGDRVAERVGAAESGVRRMGSSYVILGICFGMPAILSIMGIVVRPELF
jgi:hypothetical protein